MPPRALQRSPAPVVDLVDGLEDHCACGGACAECAAAAAGGGLTIGPPDDVFEREADAVSERVLAGVEVGEASAVSQPLVQRACACGGSAEAASDECAECRDAALRRKAFASAPRSVAPRSVKAVVASPGRGLEAPVRSSMESAFGRDLGDVRLHTDPDAAKSAAAVGALAYTVGRHVVFGQGHYEPATEAGRRLLAHELAHVIQQSGSLVTVQRQVAPLPSASRAPTTPSPPPPDVTGADEPAWILPPRVRAGAEPVYDDETHAVIAFRYSSGGYYEVYDLEGRMVEVGEPGLESPLIDPIDIIAGGLAGLGRSVFSGTARSAMRGVTAAAVEEAGAVAARGGLRAAAALLGSRALAAVRAAWRTVRLGGTLSFTETAAAHMLESGRRVPIHILRLAIRWGARTADPQGVAGAFRYVIPMFKGVRDATGRWIYKQYTLEVVLREADNTILHFLYRP